jgi:steroid 5-alpha reductase family enzyme
MNVTTYLEGLAVILILAIVTWIVSVFKRDVSIVDSLWSLMILAAGFMYAMSSDVYSMRNTLILGLLLIWALRLAIYVTWRNWGEEEDHRYQKIRASYSPHFAVKSLGIIFLFQAVVAWIISLPLWPAITSNLASLQLLDILAIALWLTGMFFEVIGDWQLAQFKANPDNQGKVMNQGLWRYTRHPNYFGEALIWWGFYLFAVSAGAWWTFPAPLLMNWLLLKFSGVVILEKTIVERRPAYKQYIETTNAFIPGPRKQPQHMQTRGQLS